MMVTPSTTFPHPISKHLANFSEEELTPIRKHAAQQLIKMTYAKQLEDMYALYDCYDNKDAEIIDKSIKKYKPDVKTYPGLLSIIGVAAFIKYKKLPLLNFNSYVNNIYAVSYITLLGYTYGRFAESYNRLRFVSEVFPDSSILETGNLIHSYNTNIINNLRFNENETQ